MRARFHILILLLAGFVLSACGGGGGDGPGQVVAFQVTAINPVDNQSNVALMADVFVYLSRPVDPSTLTFTALRVVAESGDEIPGQRSVPGLDKRQIRFRPTFGYLPFAVHRVIVTSELHDEDGEPLDQDYTFEFQAEEEGPTLPTQAQLTDLGDALAVGRWFHRMTLVAGNRFLVTGGYSGTNTVTGAAENLVPGQQQSFLLQNGLNQARANHVQVRLLDGRVLIAGGETLPFQPIASAEIYDPQTQQFALVASMQRARTFAHGVRLPNGNVLVTGGQTPTAARRDAEIYDPSTDTWTLLANEMNEERDTHFSALTTDGNVVVVGGVAGFASSQIFDVSTGQFDPPPNPTAHPHYFGAGAILADGRPVVFGGLDSKGVSIYDAALGFIGAINGMVDERAFASATTFPDGRVLVIGGFHVASSLRRNTAEVFVPIGSTGKMVRIPDFSLPNPTTHHAAGLDANGNVWITGGLPADFQLPGLRQVYFVRPVE